MQSLQRERCRRGGRWWPGVGEERFTALAEIARSAAAGQAVLFSGSGVSSPDGSAGLDARMRKVAKAFGLSVVVEPGIGEGRVLLEAALDRANADPSGAAADRLARLIDEEFATTLHSLPTALVVSAPSAVLCAVAPDGALGFAADGVRGHVQVRELFGTYRDPASMTPAAAARYGLPPLRDLLAASVPAHPDFCVFIGLEPDPMTLLQLVDSLEGSVPGFAQAHCAFVQHVPLRASVEGVFERVLAVTAAGDRAADRARSFEEILDALIALLWASGEGRFELPLAGRTDADLPRVEAGSTSVWATSAGLPGRRR